MTHWAYSFYDVQDELTGCYAAPVHPFHLEKAAEVRRDAPGLRLLELGSGGGQFAVAAALEGFAVTALEYRDAGNAHAQALAAQHGVTLGTVTGDFYVADPGGPFDVICYWDGFGIGSDDEQRHLLRRLPGWLAPGGHALIEVYSPGYWQKHAGYTRRTPEYVQTYGYDADGARMTDTYAAGGDTRTQSLRCYAPADLRLLLRGTGLTLTAVQAGGRYDRDAGVWHPQATLAECMTWTATLRPPERPAERPASPDSPC